MPWQRMPAKPLALDGSLEADCDNLRVGVDASPSRDHALVLDFVASVTRRDAQAHAPRRHLYVYSASKICHRILLRQRDDFG